MAKEGAERRVPVVEPLTKAEVRDMIALRLSHNKILETKKLPTLPRLAYRLLELLSQDEVDISELEEIIRHDQALTAKVLSVANSAYTGTQREITSIQKAIITLGLKQVSEIAFSICLISIFKPLKSVYTYDVREFWIHCIAVAFTSRLIAQSLDEEDEDLFFTVGLLHDIGHLLQLHLFPEVFEEVLRRQEKSGRDLLAEETELGLPHTWLGKWLLKRWGLPKAFELVARYHHHPFLKRRFLHTAGIVKLADVMVHKLGLAKLPGGQRADVSHLLQYLGLDEDLYHAIEDHLLFLRENVLETWASLI